MIRVDHLISRSRVGRCETLGINRIARVTIAVRDLEQSMEFYARVFGFRIAENESRPTGASVIMAGPEHIRLAIHQYGDAAVPLVPVCRDWGFIVSDLESVRDAVWDLGVNVAHDSGEPDQIYRRSNGRSLYIHDPDGNDIELVEECTNRSRTAPFGDCRSNARQWRRWVHPDCPAASS